MSARLVWIVTCEICGKTAEFDGTLTVEQLGDTARTEGWELPIYGGTFCTGCYRIVKTLART